MVTTGITHAEYTMRTDVLQGGVGTGMDIRKFLYDCRRSVFDVRSLEKQRDAVRMPMGPSDNSASIVANGSRDNNPTATALNTYDYYDELLRLKVEERRKDLIFFETVIGMLTDTEEQTVLRYYFGQGLTDAKIAEEVQCNERTVSDRRRNAVKKLQRKF